MVTNRVTQTTKNGLILRLTFTMNVTGMLAAEFITDIELIELELPKSTCTTGVLHVPIPWLCIGSVHDLRHNAVGYLELYRRERCSTTGTTSEERNFAFYQTHILQPFIDIARQKLYGWDPTSPISDELTAVCWTDGASVQLNAIVSREK